ncbi:GIY-YIG nuclease family protein [Malikia sp.]|uniref:GIY-YIG nuclease family protein n=1 Tax=Malikia sp. TaxID=2070706 RepID=UPI002608AD0E|nr:GIY-YIG nuclease family protein [Malikia sp.]
MAQQTRVGHVYVISNIGSFGENVYKIGMTRRLEPLDRVRELGELGDASVPFEFDVHAMIYSEDIPKLEKSAQPLHARPGQQGQPAQGVLPCRHQRHHGAR